MSASETTEGQPFREWEAHILVWDSTDETKQRDPHYWRSTEEVEENLRLAPPDIASRLPEAGTPKGASLAEMREEFGGDEGELVMGGDLEITPAPGVSKDEIAETERYLRRPEHRIAFSLAPWRDADPDTTRFMRLYLQRAHPGFTLANHGAWAQARATEISPGVFVQDERPAGLTG